MNVTIMSEDPETGAIQACNHNRADVLDAIKQLLAANFTTPDGTAMVAVFFGDNYQGHRTPVTTAFVRKALINALAQLDEE